ncbi:MAG: TetR family transcriptional regulator [Candidatus Andeanibacterium colombiense]|uniref:TetR family transcriptional regulator n=1 Tax=Candidatus Andeanibacterium colombiense TaxID=3121345 RepID=A0AAJ5X3S6_9SPHN|nr:MAG: TetR family transcriptional regulator [Sphingomonadaceae bacterium]
MTKPAPKPLDRNSVIDAAFALLREHGLAALSMRRLAERLSVQAPALYWHFTDKGELLGLMAAAIYRDAREGVGECDGWREWLIAYGKALRHRLAREHDAAQLCAIAPPAREGAPGSADAIAAPLTGFGMARPDALTAIASVSSLALGWSTFEANGPMQHFLEEMIDFDRSFEVGLRALVHGL